MFPQVLAAPYEQEQTKLTDTDGNPITITRCLSNMLQNLLGDHGKSILLEYDLGIGVILLELYIAQPMLMIY